MKKILLIVLMSICFSSVAQKSEKDRAFLLSNYISDIGLCSYCSKESYLQKADMIFQTKTIVASPKYTLKRKSMKHELCISDSIDYHIQFYKIQGDSVVGNLYVIHLVDDISRNIDVWIRLVGWRENDMRFLYLMYKKNGMKEKDFKRMVLSWCSIDTVVIETQIDKILDGAIKNKMEDDCFISEHYKLLDGLRVRDMGPTDNKNLYSVFSRQPMDGMWLEF